MTPDRPKGETVSARSIVAVTFNEKRPVDFDRVRRLLGANVELKPIEMEHRPWTESEEDAFLAKAGSARSIILRPGRLTRRLLSRMPNLETVSLHGTGLNQTDVAACTDLGIFLTNAPGGNAVAVAEQMFGLLIALLRRTVRADNLVRAGRWSEAVYTGNELQNKVLGIVGLGNVGLRVARIAHGFSMMTVGYDPGVSVEQFRAAGVVPVSLDAVMAESDVVTLHVPLLPQTQGMIDARRLSLMKPSAVLVNTARGALVDEGALLKLLQEKRIAGAALDAFVEEPLPANHPFSALDNVVLTPHSAAQTHEVTEPIIGMICEDINRVYSGTRPRFLGNPEVIPVRAALGRKP
jgi:D-3-phosphoglycerate dehydrogenase